MTAQHYSFSCQCLNFETLKIQEACCLLYWTGLNWFIGCLGRATCTVHSISSQTIQEGIKYTKAKVQIGLGHTVSKVGILTSSFEIVLKIKECLEFQQIGFSRRWCSQDILIGCFCPQGILIGCYKVYLVNILIRLTIYMDNILQVEVNLKFLLYLTFSNINILHPDSKEPWPFSLLKKLFLM